jgi:oxygen-independent coproporphyrinogen-3 oxidase
VLRKAELNDEHVETIYFGGGTPSIFSVNEIELLINTINKNYKVTESPEITLEANPDDLTDSYIKDLYNSPVNRLSIGVQSFFDDDLKLMNRAHNAEEARTSLIQASNYFENLSIDLIYGIPKTSIEKWMENIEIALSFNIPHISSYALTIEPKTAFASFINKGLMEELDDRKAEEQFHVLIEKLDAANFIHYELSNFGKVGFFSKNNTSYWTRKPYLGIGPSAHSYNGKQRSWNVRNNSKYINALKTDQLPSEVEVLTLTDRFNEQIMTGLRTIWGVSLSAIENEFGPMSKDYLLKQSKKYINEHLLYIEDDKLLVTKKGKFLSDGIASNLFKLN